MKRLFYILISISICVASCQKSEMQVLRSLPSEVSFTHIDLTGARSLAVMQTVGGEVVTKSHGGTAYRLCVLDEEGQAKIASISLKTVGNESNKAWKKIKQSLTLVPQKIVPISADYLHLDDVMAVHNENLAEITDGAGEYTAINGYLQKLGGGYILRISDGALFKSPLPYVSVTDLPGAPRRFIQPAPDGKTFVAIHPSMGLDLQNPLYFPVIISDQGSAMRITSSPSDFLGQILDEAMVWAPENQRFVVFDHYHTPTGAWSFDHNLKPLFLDYSEKLSSIIARSNDLMFTYKGRCYIIDVKETSGAVVAEMYQIAIDGDRLDCSLAFSTPCDGKLQNLSFNNYKDTITIETEVGILYIADYISVNIDFGASPSITLGYIPYGFGEFDLNGKAYKPGIDTIEVYDAFTNQQTVVSVQWNKTSVGRLVSAQMNVTSGDYYTVKGRTREATEVVALIEKSTGLVTITNLTEFGSPVITTSYRLN